MKKFTVIFIFLLGTLFLGAQNYSDLFDTSPEIGQVGIIETTRDTWDTVFVYPLPPPFPVKTAAETDGNYIYVTGWSTPEMFKYDMQGNLLDTFLLFNMTDTINDIRDLAYDGQYYYGAAPRDTSRIYRIDFDNQVCIDTIHVVYRCRALAYNDDDSVFYSNNWDTDIIVFNHNGTIVDTLVRSSQTHTYASYYGLAYDNWSAGGPYLWAFSQEGTNSGTLVQLELPSGHETGFYKDVGSLAPGSIAGGLFTYPDYDSSIAVIGGVMQNDLMFGFELAPVMPPPASYQIGGNLSAASASLDEGIVDLYRIYGNEVVNTYSTSVNSLGDYLFTEMLEGDYMIHAMPEAGSSTADSYVPTYHDGNIHWEDVNTIYISDNSLENDIDLVEMAVLGTGIGYVDGHVYDISTDTEIPMENAQVMLMNEYNECIAIVYTDGDGAFSFGDIALESYGLLVEIPGKVMEPMSFILSEPEPGLPGVILYVTDGSIMVGLDEQPSSSIRHIGDIYPNPAGDNASIGIMMENASTVQLKIYTASGQLVQMDVLVLDKGQNQVSFDLTGLNRGIYYLNLEFANGLTQTRKLVKME